MVSIASDKIGDRPCPITTFKAKHLKTRFPNIHFPIYSLHGHRRYYKPSQHSALEAALIGGPPDLG